MWVPNRGRRWKFRGLLHLLSLISDDPLQLSVGSGHVSSRVACCESANAYAMDDVPVQSPVGSADLT